MDGVHNPIQVAIGLVNQDHAAPARIVGFHADDPAGVDGPGLDAEEGSLGWMELGGGHVFSLALGLLMEQLVEGGYALVHGQEVFNVLFTQKERHGWLFARRE